MYDDRSHRGLIIVAVHVAFVLFWNKIATEGHCPLAAPLPPTSRAATPSDGPGLPQAKHLKKWASLHDIQWNYLFFETITGWQQMYINNCEIDITDAEYKVDRHMKVLEKIGGK